MVAGGVPDQVLVGGHLDDGSLGRLGEELWGSSLSLSEGEGGLTVLALDCSNGSGVVSSWSDGLGLGVEVEELSSIVLSASNSNS